MLPGCRHSLSPTEQWQARILAAYGGAESLARIKNLVYAGRIATRGDRGTVVITLSRPERLRATMQYSKKFEDRLLMGNRGWRDFGEGFEEVSGPSLAAMIFQYNHLDLPMGLIDGNYRVSFAEHNVDGKTFPTLELNRASVPPMTIYIDPDTGLIRGVEGTISAGDHEVVMAVEYGDYRPVEGVMFPHRLINFVNGKAIAESRFDRITVNGEPAPNVFPEAPQTPPR